MLIVLFQHQPPRRTVIDRQLGRASRLGPEFVVLIADNWFMELRAGGNSGRDVIELDAIEVDQQIITRIGNHLVELGGDVVQLYLRDPAGNLVEIDQSGVDRLPDDLRGQLRGLWDFNPQSDENMRGRLFVPD